MANITDKIQELTKREYFISIMMQGLAGSIPEYNKEETIEKIVKQAVDLADELIYQLYFSDEKSK